MAAKILIVDDEPSLLRLLEYGLEVEGYDVITAENGETAMAMVDRERPDLVILDVMLPDIDGNEVCKRLRQNPHTASLPIIMLSARVQVADRIKGLQAGADEYVDKPVDSDELVARVDGLLRRPRAALAKPKRRSGRVLAFLGAKGGVGTTTLAAQVAVSLAQEGGKIVATELRGFLGTLASQLELEIEWGYQSGLFELSAAQIGPDELGKRLVEHGSGLRVLVDSAAVNRYREPGGDQSRALVEALASMADCVVVDLASQLNEAARAVLQRSDFVTLVLEPDPRCVGLGKKLVELLYVWGVGKEQIGAVVVQRLTPFVPPLDRISPALREQLGCDIVGIIPPSFELFRRGFDAGASLSTGAFTSSVTSFAEHLTEHVLG